MSTSHSFEKVVFCAGANISDNTIVLPGSIIAKNAVLGSSTVCPAGRYLPPETTWLGSRFGEPELLESNCEGDNQVIFSKDVKESDIELVGDESTLRPFGRAVSFLRSQLFDRLLFTNNLTVRFACRFTLEEQSILFVPHF